MSDEFTPSIDQIRSVYVFDRDNKWIRERGIAFDRALADHDRAVANTARKEALEDIAESYVYVHAVSRTHSKVYQWLRARAASISTDKAGEGQCLSCEERAEDSGEGRFCGKCQDYEGTCINDHCLTCGAGT
jgi:hypothetical protein